MSPLYGPVVQEHANHPHNQGSLDRPTASHEGVNPFCGDKLRIELRAADGAILEARFSADACMVAIAAASLLTDLIQGLPVAGAAAISKEQLLAALQSPLRAARIQCATLSLDVLRAALAKL